MNSLIFIFNIDLKYKIFIALKLFNRWFEDIYHRHRLFMVIYLFYSFIQHPFLLHTPRHDFINKLLYAYITSAS